MEGSEIFDKERKREMKRSALRMKEPHEEREEKKIGKRRRNKSKKCYV